MPEKDDIVTDVSKRCVIDGISEFERDERRARPFSAIAIWAGIVLAKCRGGTVTSAQVSSGIGIMHLCWGL